MEEEVIITEECVEENPEENQEDTNAIQKTEDTEQEKNEPDEENELLQEINTKSRPFNAAVYKKRYSTRHTKKRLWIRCMLSFKNIRMICIRSL